MNLKQKSLKALIWSFIDSFGVYFVKFGFTIAIARKLEPRDYGLVGMIGIFIAISSLITEGGFSMALIQKKDTNQEDYSTVFFFNIGASLILYLVLFITSGLLADFYNEPMLKDITRIAAIGIILSALITVHVTILNKNLDFKHQALINMSSALTSGITGVTLAYRGFGVWSLVFQTLVGAILSVILFWSLTKWKPSLNFSLSSFKSLYKYGINIFAQGFTSIILDQIYYPLIGKFYNATQLGFFANADRFYQIFVRRITIAYGKVAFPAFSLLQDDSALFSTTYRKTTLSLAFILIPLTAFLIISAKPIILILLSSKWASSIPFLQLLYIDGFFFPFLLLNQNVLNALGKSRVSLKIDIFKKIIVVIGVFITFRIGVQALIISQVTSTVIGLLFSILFIKNNLIKQRLLKDLFPIINITICCFSFSIFIGNYLYSNIAILLFQILIFIFYLIISRLIKTNGYNYFISFIRPIIPIPIQKYI